VPSEPANVRVSVLVCTRNRADSLARCLASVRADGGGEGREVLVVDNGSTDHTAAVVEAAARLDPSVSRVIEPRTGKSHALNAGVRGARGEYLLFTDDDVEVQPGWTGALVTALAAEGTVAAGGRTLPRWEVNPPPWLDAELARDLGVRDLGTVARELGPPDVIGANMGLRASVLAAAGRPFDVALGPRGSLKVDYEEFDLLQRLGGHGRLVYAPSAVVLHHVPAARVSWQWMRRTYFQRGFGKARMARRRGAPLNPWLQRARQCRHNWWVARSARGDHRRGQAGPAEALAEFQAYLDFGHDLDMTLARYPRLAAWASRLPV
jgi:glycosyltransferase involved in cell wall biosynthesis